MPGTSAEYEHIGYWCELDVGSDFCVLSAVPLFLLSAGKQETCMVGIYLRCNLQFRILDDFLLHTVTDEREIKVLFEIMEKRSELCKSTIVCSQREPNSWASMILNDEVSANSILKRATKHYTVVIKPRE